MPRPAAAPASAIELVHGDFLAESPRRVAAGSIDVIVTSPPYNLGIAYSQYEDDRPREEYLAWTDRWAAEAGRVLSPAGSLFLNVGIRPSEPWGAWEVAEGVRRRFKLQNVIHWVKSISIAKEDVGKYPGITGDVTVGHYKPINSKRYLNDAQEYVFHFTHSGAVELDRLAVGVPYQDASNIARWSKAGGGVHCRGNVWFIPYKTIQSRKDERPHPATFPPKLPEMCMRLHGLARVRRAMDPFLGLGSSALAAQSLGVPFLGFEIDAEYLALAKQRLAGEGQFRQGAGGARGRAKRGGAPGLPRREELF